MRGSKHNISMAVHLEQKKKNLKNHKQTPELPCCAERREERRRR